MRRNIGLGSSVALLVLLATTAPADQSPAAIEHVGLSTEDRFVQCARTVFGAPVVLDAVSRWPDASILCPVPKMQLIESLKAHDLLTFEADGWVYLVSAGWFKPTTGAYARWKDLHVTFITKEWVRPEARKLSIEEMEQVRKAILDQARPPVAIANEGGVIALMLQVDVWVLDAQRKAESVVAVWGVEHDVRRLIYGEIEGGVYRPLWDSPLVPGSWLGMGYPDLDGDGVREIAVQAVVSTSGRGLALVVFDINGREISRQAENKDDCWWMNGRTGPGISCPITGQREDGIDFEKREDGKTDIVVYRFGKPCIFRLVNHSYVEQKPERK